MINAGDGWHEHPTQALLDCFTVRQVLAERKGAAPEELGIDCFEGLRVLIVGDIRHSRVARSEVLAYSALGASVTLAAPGSLLPPSLEGWPVTVAAGLRRRAGRRRRGLAAAAPGRAGERLVRPQPARVHGRVGSHGPPGGPAGRRRHRHAPRPHGARRRDRIRRGRSAPHRRHPAGHQRCGRAHGHPLPPPRRGMARRGVAMAEVTWSSAAARWSTPEGLRRLDVAVAGAHGGRAGRSRSTRPAGGHSCSMPRAASIGPGLVDLHTHLRQPGREEAETVESGARAAALGGYTAVVAMPNTEPAIDSAGVARDVLALGRAAAGRGGGVGCHHGGPGRQGAGPDGRAGRAGRAHLHRRRSRGAGRRPHAPCPRLRQGHRGHAGPALRGREPVRRRGHARGMLVQPAGPARDPRRGRGVDGGPRHPAGPAHRCPGPLPASLHCRIGASSCAGPRRRDCRSRPKPRPTTCC